MMKPVSGLQFVHAHLMCQDALASGENRPALCQVLRVGEGFVWYEVLAADGTPIGREWCDVAHFSDICAGAA